MTKKVFYRGDRSRYESREPSAVRWIGKRDPHVFDNWRTDGTERAPRQRLTSSAEGTQCR